MKRAIVILLLLLSGSMLVSCSGPVEKNYDKLSELRTVVYDGGDETLKISAISGQKEEPFIIDGVAEGMTDLTLITIIPSQFDESVEYSYKVTISDVEYEGNFVIHPFEDSLSAMLPQKTFASVLDISITCGGKSTDYELISPITEKYIDADKALEIALRKLSGQIKSLGAEGLSYEIYLRLTANPISNAEGYYWYVAFVGSDDTTYAALIDPETMEIVAIRD